jgi:hypothetical protein
MPSRGLSVAEKLLMAAITLDAGERRTFTAEDLVVAAWTSFPETFGLRGHLDDHGNPMYPDSNRVFMEIMGPKPLRQRGLIEKVGNKRYRVTEAGRQRASETRDADRLPGAAKAAVDRNVLEDFRRFVAARATTKFREGRSDEITFHDACSFWGISPRSTARELRSRLAHFDAVVEAVRHAVGSQDFTLEHGGVSFSAKDVEALMDLSGQLRERFEAELAIIMKRKDERR